MKKKPKLSILFLFVAMFSFGCKELDPPTITTTTVSEHGSSATGGYYRDITLGWDANTDGVIGYKLYYGNYSRNYTKCIDVKNVKNYVIANLEVDKSYYFAVTAYNGSLESDFSNEVNVVASPIKSTSTTADILISTTTAKIFTTTTTVSSTTTSRPIYTTTTVKPLTTTTTKPTSTTTTSVRATTTTTIMVSTTTIKPTTTILITSTTTARPVTSTSTSTSIVASTTTVILVTSTIAITSTTTAMPVTSTTVIPTTTEPITTTSISDVDCLIQSVKQVEDYGLTGKFIIELSANLDGKELGFFGQSAPDGAWANYPVDQGKVTILNWPKGRAIEFSVYSIESGSKQYFDPSCSRYVYPLNAAPSDRHLKVTLGNKTVCPEQKLNDTIVLSVVNLGGNIYRIYLDFTLLPIQNYQRLFVSGQKAPDSAWINYDVIDKFPCYYFEVYWSDYANPFHFSGGVIKTDGSEQWFDPSSSDYFCDGHLCIMFGDFN